MKIGAETSPLWPYLIEQMGPRYHRNADKTVCQSGTRRPVKRDNRHQSRVWSELPLGIWVILFFASHRFQLKVASGRGDVKGEEEEWAMTCSRRERARTRVVELGLVRNTWGASGASGIFALVAHHFQVQSEASELHRGDYLSSLTFVIPWGLAQNRTQHTKQW